MFQPGEFHAEFYVGYLTNQTVSGLYAQEFGGAVIVLEREYELSEPRKKERVTWLKFCLQTAITANRRLSRT